MAQNGIELRIGMHSEYARLVFGWPEKTTYTIKEQAGTLTIEFADGGTLDTSQADLQALPEITDIEEISQDPLRVTFRIPQGSRLRDFSIGKRVVVDVYLPQDVLRQKKAATPPQEEVSDAPEPRKKPAQLQAQNKVEQNPVPLNSSMTQKEQPATKEQPEEKKAEEIITEPLPKPKIALVTERLEQARKRKDERWAQSANETQTNQQADSKQEQAPQYPPEVARAIEDKHHVVSFRGTQELSLAAYIEGGVLWIAVLGANDINFPSLLSPTPEIFSKIERFYDGDGFDLYRVRLPDQEHGSFYTKAIGGALAWDIIMGDKVRETKPVEPRREISTTKGARGGKVIWPLELLSDIVEFPDPVYGRKLFIVTVKNANQLSGAARHFVDFDVLHSPVGMVIRPKVDDLQVRIIEEGVEISRPGAGLSVGLPKDIEAIELYEKNKKERIKAKAWLTAKESIFFQFDEWKLGSGEALPRYEMVLLSAMHGHQQDIFVQELLKLGKMFLAHGRAAEALGYFEYARSVFPALGAGTEFRLLRGAAKVLDWKNEEALADFAHQELEENEEVKLWRAFVLAGLEDWQQAASYLPEDYTPIYVYPDKIGLYLALVLVEINLRDGDVEQADELIRYIDTKQEKLKAPQRAALQYLKGEAARQRGEIEEAKNLWQGLTRDKDDLYRTKAGLALTMLLRQQNEISNKEAIDRLERLRYAWRGDGLEAQVNYELGNAYFKDKKFVKGLSIMREAATTAKNMEALAERIAGNMARTYTDMFMTNELDNVSALDAVAVYDQFKELTPVGKEGDKLVQRLAEHLVKSDLLGKAGKLLRYQVDHRLRGKERLEIAIRLAAISLLDKAPQKALDALGKAGEALRHISDKEEIKQRQREIDLLKIRAYSQNGEYNKALSLIEKLPMDKIVNRLRADIAWKVGYWDVAAAALKEVLIDEDIRQGDMLTPQQVDLILSRAIALNLDNDTIALANMREKFTGRMVEANRDKARQFELITRKQSPVMLDDRDTLMSAVAEVDLFQEFLESYRNSQTN
ncbi:MAG: hypothetical protein ACLFP8_01410 [Alphaproteobacteria bacterium]